MTLPSPIGSAVFTDGELTNETKWYTRIFSVVNQIIAYLAAQSGQQRVYTYTRPTTNTTDSFSSGSFASLLSITLPSTAAAGSYDLSVHLDITSTAAAIGTLRVIQPNGGTTDRTYNPVPVTPSRTPMDYSTSFTWGGGAGVAQAQVSVSAGTGQVVNAAARIDLKYIGP